MARNPYDGDMVRNRRSDDDKSWIPPTDQLSWAADSSLGRPKPDRAPSTTWCLKRDDLNTFVRTAPGDRIVIAGEYEYEQQWIELSRSDARLLAKRINQCLDET